MIKKIFSILILFFAFALPLSASSIQDIKVGEQIEVNGVVIVLPGVLGTQIFYINGAQVYSYYKDFPELKLGDEIIVNGVISRSRGENRIKISTKDDIKIINHNLSTNPKQIKIIDINDSLIGTLIKIKGLVIEKTGQKIFVYENGSEVVVYVKQNTGINKSNIEEGQEVEIIGILSKSNDYLRILPRNPQDIIFLEVLPLKKNSIKSSISNKNNEKILLGQQFPIEEDRNNFYDLRHYFILSSVILGIIFIILLIIKRKQLN